MTSDLARAQDGGGKSAVRGIKNYRAAGVALTPAEVPYFAQGGRNPLALYPQLP